MNVDLISCLKLHLNAFNIPIYHVTAPFDNLEKLDGGIRHHLNPSFNWRDAGDNILARLKSDTFFLIEDIFGAKYALFEIPDEPDSAYVIGPWRGKCRTPEQVSWADSAFDGRMSSVLGKYYDTLPVVNDDIIYSIASSLIKQIYRSDNYRIVQLYESNPMTIEPDFRYFSEPDFIRERSSTLLEQRAVAEDDVFKAVSYGDFHSALLAYRKYSVFSKTNSPEFTLRQCQNELISFNVLMRKALESVAVHPYYIDIINAKYTDKIDSLTDSSDYERLIRDMIMEYCTYVHRYSLKQYSPLIQKVINYVNLHLDAPLSLKKLSELYFISPSYLSSLFRQETGATLTDYINLQRINKAAQQLSETSDSISTIAAGVGILDVNYFSKLFKKTLGVTPTQYRKENTTKSIGKIHSQ
jgi:AraC-like DNA-binding protein